jgi:hypothetical protein
VLFAALSPLVVAIPAYADDSGGNAATGWSFPESLGITIGAAAAICALVSLLVSVPQRLTRPRYRTGRPWSYDPVWFAGPPEPDRALASAKGGSVTGGGASAEW